MPALNGAKDTPEQSKKRGGRKLKMYSGKKRLSSGKSRKMADDDEETQQTPVTRVTSPELGDAPPSRQPEASKARQEIAQTQDTETGDSPIINGDADTATPDADAPDSSSKRNRQRKDRVSRNRSFLESLKSSQTKASSSQAKPKKARTRRSKGAADDNADNEGPAIARPAHLAEDEEGLPTPPYTDQMPDKLKVSTWLRDDSANKQAASTSEPAPADVDHPSNAYGALLHDAEDAEPRADDEQDQEQEVEDERREYEIPSDSDDVYEPEDPKASAEKPKRASKAKAKSTPKEKAKRKRDSTDNPDSVPAKKKKRKSEAAATSNAGHVKPAPSAAASRRASNGPDYPSAGNFTPAEVELVEAAFEDARKSNGFTEAQMIQKVQSSAPEVRALLITLTQEILPNRNRKAIQRFCRRHFNDAERGKWTGEQDALLRAAQTERPQKWRWISEKVGRLPEDCRDRWRNFESLKDSRHTDVWTRDEELALAKAITESVQGVAHRLGRPLTPAEEDDYISWPLIINKMEGRRNRLQCTNKWRKIRARNAKEKAEREAEALTEDKEETQRQKNAAKARYSSLKMGDIYNIFKEVEYAQAVGRIDDINVFWAVVTKLHSASPYTTQDRRMAYKKLKDHIDESGDFEKNVQLIMRWIEKEFGDQLDMRILHDDPRKPAQLRSKKAVANGKAGKSNKNFRSEERVQESDEEEGVAQDVDMTGITNDNEDADMTGMTNDDEDLADADEGAQDDREAEDESAEEDAVEEAAEEEDEAVSDSEDELTPVPEGHTEATAAEPEAPNSPHVSESDYNED